MINIKKIIPLYIISIILLLCGCNNTNYLYNSSSDSIDSNNNFSINSEELPANYTPQMAKNDNCFVIIDNRIVENKCLWTDFIKLSSKGNNANIRLVYFDTENGNAPYYNDICFKDGRNNFV